MNPYLEHPRFWASFHFRLIGAIASALVPQLSLDYYVEVETRTYQSEDDDEALLIGIPDAIVVSNSQDSNAAQPLSQAETAVATQTRPEKVSLPMVQPIQERYLEVRDSQTDAVITVIEVLSPKNKRAGEGRVAYEKKRRLVLDSATHLVEIDLLRGGNAMPVVGQRSPTAYRILVSRSQQRPGAELYGIPLPQPLPTVPIPLKAGEPEPLIDLQTVVDQITVEARYAIRIDYRQPPPPPELFPADQEWLQAIVAAIHEQ
jgi:Protein of unknown function (DUF4058)